jgi:hypothetical protein
MINAVIIHDTSAARKRYSVLRVSDIFNCRLRHVWLPLETSISTQMRVFLEAKSTITDRSPMTPLSDYTNG